MGSCSAQACVTPNRANGGTCVSDGASFHCECPSGVIGPLCGNLMDPRVQTVPLAYKHNNRFLLCNVLLQGGPLSEDRMCVSL